MRNFLFFTILLICSFFANAESPSHMVIQCADGSKITYILSDEPKVTFDGPKMVINSKGLSVEHPLNNVDKITYENDTDSSLESVFTDTLSYTVKDDILYVQNYLSDFTICVFEVNGTCVINKYFVKEESASVSLRDLDSGVYVLLINNNSFKIHLK